MEEKKLIYSAEDEPAIRELLECTLEASGFRARAFETAEELLAAVEEEPPALILLDIMLPGMDGIAAMQKIKAARPALPVILLTAKGTELNKVRGLELGADDYIAKPFGVLELVARVKARLREAPGGSASAGPVTLDVKKHTAEYCGVPLALTVKEYALLRVLVENAGSVVPRDVLLDRVWGIDFEGETRTLDMHVKSLREKLENAGSGGRALVETVRGVGYVFLRRG